MTWRESCTPLIAAVIEKVGTADMKALKKALRAAYPWGERKYHPYKIWCDEVRVQLGKKPIAKRGGRKPVKSSEGQQSFINKDGT